MDSCTPLISWWLHTYMDGHNFILHRLYHHFMGKKNPPRVGYKHNNRITSHMCISGNWYDKIKVLKNPMNQLAYKIPKSALLYTLASSNWQYQCLIKAPKPVINVKDNYRHSDASYFDSDSCRLRIAAVYWLFDDVSWSDNWRLRPPVPSSHSNFSGLVEKSVLMLNHHQILDPIYAEMRKQPLLQSCHKILL